MGYTEILFLLVVAADTMGNDYFKICVSPSSVMCTYPLGVLVCIGVKYRIDCALKLMSGTADFGYFSGEELLLLSQQHPDFYRVVATVRDSNRMEPYAFEAVAVVPNTHTGGLEGLRGGRYCHPGLDQQELPWSPRVLKTLEQSVTQKECPVGNNSKIDDELDVEALNNFFSAGCRPGPWSADPILNANLKSQFPNLCSLCGDNTCNGYSINMGVAVAGVRNDNRHIQALECLRVNSNGTAPAVGYVAWLHVREFFTARNPQDAASFSLLCPDGTLQPLTALVLANTTAPCSFVKQPWGAIVANTTNSGAVLNFLPLLESTTSSYSYNVFEEITGGASTHVVLLDTPITVASYTNPIRIIGNIDATPSCLPAVRWCTWNPAQQNMCSWTRAAAYSLGVKPTVACHQRADVTSCFNDEMPDIMKYYYGFVALRQKGPGYPSMSVLLYNVQLHFSDKDTFNSQLINMKLYSPSDMYIDLVFNNFFLSSASPVSSVKGFTGHSLYLIIALVILFVFVESLLCLVD